MRIQRKKRRHKKALRAFAYFAKALTPKVVPSGLNIDMFGPERVLQNIAVDLRFLREREEREHGAGGIIFEKKGQYLYINRDFKAVPYIYIYIYI